MTARPLGLCLVGYGSIAACHMEAFRRIESVRPHVVVGRREEPTAEFARHWRFEHHTLDLDAALSDSEVDVVCITSPNDLHAPQAEKTLLADKDLLLEIPIAMNLADAERVTALARRRGRILMVCHSMRFVPAAREIRRRVAEGRLRLHHVLAFFGIMRRSNTSWTGRTRSWTDNILWHHGAHLVDLALWTTGCRAVTDVHCRFGPEHPTQKVMDMSLAMVLPGGALVTIAQSYNIEGMRHRALFIGEEATLEYDGGTLRDAEGREIVAHRAITEVNDQDAHFIDCVLERRDTEITGEEVLPAMRVLEAAQASADGARSSA